jgi:hypothetical protein
MINTALLFLLVLGIAAVYFQRRKIQDADAMAWATAAEPFEVISRHHADTTVTTEAAYIREQLTAHGNKFLNPDSDVWEYVYSADVLTTSRNFQVWKDLVLIDVQKRREMWRAQKMEWNKDAAKQQFAGQTINTQPSSN